MIVLRNILADNIREKAQLSSIHDLKGLQKNDKLFIRRLHDFILRIQKYAFALLSLAQPTRVQIRSLSLTHGFFT
jgi:hypothetical protein